MKYGYLQKQTNWNDKYYYLKSEVLYQMTVVFCDRFIPIYGDRTRDQMIQAARSCKQNIVEGHADGVTSTEMMSKLINVARASIQELQQDYVDYAKARSLPVWDKEHPRFDALLNYCRIHNSLENYQEYFDKWSDEEYCNTAITLCRMVDKMLYTVLTKMENTFLEEGGIRERMHKARTGFRAEQDAEMKLLRQENIQLKAEILRLQTILNDNGIKF